MTITPYIDSKGFLPSPLPKPTSYGRREIRSNVQEVTAENVRDVLAEALPIYLQNKADTLYLWWYYRGYQPVLNRDKEIRPDIKNCVVENRANEIISFKVGYEFGEPVQYIGRSTDERVTTNIKQLNDMMFAESKASHDRDLCEWWEICGNAYRMVLPDKKAMADEIPFEIYTLDPTLAFVVYANDYTNRKLMSCVVTYDENNNEVYNCYTDTKQFIVTRVGVLETPNTLGINPIVEYKANNARLGAFEIVLPLLDAINTVASNRVDAVEQFVQALLIMYNVDMDSNQYDDMVKKGAIKLKSIDGVLSPSIEYITAELNQTETQTLVDYMYQTVLTICGMPNRSNGGAAAADTGAAVLLRDGWSLAEARAKDTEWSFKRSEQDFLRVVLRICDLSRNFKLDLTIPDIDCRFTRRNLENVQSKAQVLDMLLKNNWIDPLEAYAVSGLFSDAEGAYLSGLKFHEEQMQAAQDMLSQEDNEIVDNEEKGHENLPSES